LPEGKKRYTFAYIVKKIIAISLAVVYLSISSGVVFNIHYCMGKIATVALGQNSSDKCGNCGMENDGCCHDDVKVVKIQDTQSITSFQVDFLKAEASVHSFHQPDHSLDMISLSTLVETAKSPPFKGQIPLTIKNCVFRI
jgi:hypothetical protein